MGGCVCVCVCALGSAVCGLRRRSLVLCVGGDVGDLLELSADGAGALDDGAARDGETVVLGVLVCVVVGGAIRHAVAVGGAVHAVGLPGRACGAAGAVLPDLLEHFGLQLCDRGGLPRAEEVV